MLHQKCVQEALHTSELSGLHSDRGNCVVHAPHFPCGSETNKPEVLFPSDVEENRLCEGSTPCNHKNMPGLDVFHVLCNCHHCEPIIGDQSGGDRSP